MTETAHIYTDVRDETQHLVRISARHRTIPPMIEEELTHMRLLWHELEQKRALSEHALAEWRQALARRWECEVAGQRLYLQIQSQLRDYFGDDAPYLQIIAPSHSRSASTPAELLHDLRRIEASLALMQPRPPFVGARLEQLADTCTNLDEALAWTQLCEDRRRHAVLERRLMASAYQRAYTQARQLLDQHPGVYAEIDLPEIYAE